MYQACFTVVENIRPKHLISKSRRKPDSVFLSLAYKQAKIQKLDNFTSRGKTAPIVSDK